MTFSGYILVFLIDMAAVTGQFRMPVAQYETRALMIEVLAAPAAFIMAIRTLLAKTACMNIITLMACDACLRCIAVLFPGNMAGCTLSHAMRALQQVIRFIMGKCFNIQLDYVCIATLVFAMAMIAFRIPRHPLSVNTLLLAYICIDLLMAASAQHSLALLAERLVAFSTLLLVFHVSFNNRPRFNQ